MKSLATFTSAVVLLLSAQLSSAALINSYDFDGDLSDTLGNGLDMVASGGTVGGGEYTFGANQGLRLDNALSNTSVYSIEMSIEMNSQHGYSKLIDFQNLSSDIGLYALNSGLNFYNQTGTHGFIPLNASSEIILTRSGTGLVSGYIDGALAWTFNDSSLAVPGGNILNFFEDDFATGQGEWFLGSVDYIRIYDHVITPATTETPSVPAPASILLFVLGALLVSIGRKH